MGTTDTDCVRWKRCCGTDCPTMKDATSMVHITGYRLSVSWRSRWFIVAILSMAKEPRALAPIAWQSAREIVTATFTAKRVWCVGIVTVMIFRSHPDALETLRQQLPITVII